MFKNCSSIPFVGSKWKYRNKIKNIIENNKNIDLNDKYIVIDIFGGSGALTIIFKNILKNNNNVFICNDYDKIITDGNGNLIIDDTINKTNEILNEIKKYVINDKRRTLNQEEQTIIKDILTKHKEELNDNIMLKRMVSSCVMFNSRMIDVNKLNKLSFYNRLNKNDFKLYGYNFNNIQIIHKDFKEILNKKYIEDLTNKYNVKNENVILLLDPPYLNFDMKASYKMNFWTLKDYLKIIGSFYKYNYKIIMFEHPDNKIFDIFDFIENELNMNFKHINFNKHSFNKDVLISNF